MKLYDRLYKELKFPPIIIELLNCPGLLRLRDVRMANNQFVAFPAFSTTSRYEHSLGVCYLASICAESLELDERSTLELMIACLYHDVGTPPFAHAMEEVLQAKFGFDHEKNLKDLILGTTGVFDGELAQIYQGQSLKLRSVCQGKIARRLHLDIERIARLAVGDPDDPLAHLVNSKGIDLDNIDNIFRASSAMGIIQEECGEIAKALASAFVLNNGEIYLNGLFIDMIQEWKRVRDLQYTAIFDSVDDFAYQTMIKKAINLLLEDDELIRLDKQSWRLTDSEMTYDVLLKHKRSREIMRRVLLCRPYTCLGILYIRGDNIVNYINRHLREIEEEVSEYFVDFMGMTKKKISSMEVSPVVANFYPDKRKRDITNKIYTSDKAIDDRLNSSYPQGALLGLFTPFSNFNYKSIVEGETHRRKNISFKRSQMERVCDILQNGLLRSYEVTFYGGENFGKIITNAGTDQLGLF